MEPDRRTLLRYSAAGLVAGLAGCTDDDGVEFPDENGGDPTDDAAADPSNDDAADDAEPPEADDEDDEEEDPGRRDPEYDTEIGPLTDLLVDEAGWFAREYEDSVDAFFDQVSTLVDTIEALEAMSIVTESDIETLEAAAGNLDDVTERRLEPQFSVSSRISRINDPHLADVRRHGDRGDQDALESTLSSYRREAQSVRTQQFIDRWLSIDPIDTRLLDWLSSPWLLRTLGDDEPVSYPLFEIRYEGTGEFAAFVHSTAAAEAAGEPTLRGDPATARSGTAAPSDAEPIDDVFSVVSASADRRDELFVVANEWRPQRDRSYYTAQLDSWPVYVQRYQSADAAETAIQSLLDGPVFLADVGTPVFGGDQWEQIFYRRDDRVRYAAIAQAGDNVIVAAPSTTPIEDRLGFDTVPDMTDDDRPPHWARPLTLTWLWNDTTTPGAEQ